MSMLNLHHPDAAPLSIDEWRGLLAEFVKHAVPRTKEELEAKKEEEATEWRIKEEARRKYFQRWTYKSAPKPVHFNWRKFMWVSNSGTTMLPR